LTQTKTCTKCGEGKPLSEFSRQSQNRTGYRSSCKVCNGSKDAYRLIPSDTSYLDGFDQWGDDLNGAAHPEYSTFIQRVIDAVERIDVELENALWARIRLEPSGCMTPQGISPTSKGYVIIAKNRGKYSSSSYHRTALEYTLGVFDKSLHTDHLCNNKRCCNPVHLRIATPAENAERGPHVRFTAEQVIDIYTRYHDRGETLSGLAEDYASHHSTIWHLVNRKTYRHITQEVGY
jgi:hypothetical protein